METSPDTTNTTTDAGVEVDAEYVFDIESYMSNYAPKSNLSLQRLLFLSRTVTGDSDISKKGYSKLEQLLRQKGDLQMYQTVFGTTNDNDDNNDGNDGEDGEDALMDIDGVDGAVVAPAGDGGSPEIVSKNTYPNKPPAQITIDHRYLQSTQQKFTSKRQLLEANLATSQSHISTSSIRVSYFELAKFYQSVGMSDDAVLYYQRAKEHCSSIGASSTGSGGSGAREGSAGLGSGSGSGGGSQNQHYSHEIILALAECGLETQKTKDDKMVISLYELVMNNTSNSSSNSHNKSNNNNNNNNNNNVNYSKNINRNNSSTNNDFHYSSKLKCARGIAHLNMGEYHSAATSFLSIKDVTFMNQFNTVLSAEDLALYGGLLGLITLDRAAIERTIDVEVWRERIDVIPQLREAIRLYMKADYGGCLKLIMADKVDKGISGSVEGVATIKERMARDIFLHRHMDALWKMMREKCIVQYYRPYSSVSLDIMVDSFGFDTVDEVEDVVASLIESRRILGAKIDGVRRTLTSLSVSGLERRKRKMMVRKVGMMGDKLLHEVEGMLLRLACVENDVVVVDETKSNNHHNRRRGVSGGGSGRSGASHIPYDRSAYSSDEEYYDMM